MWSLDETNKRQGPFNGTNESVKHEGSVVQAPGLLTLPYLSLSKSSLSSRIRTPCCLAWASSTAIKSAGPHPSA